MSVTHRIRTCKKHGVLAPDEIYNYTRKDKITGAVISEHFYCKACKNKSSHEWQRRNYTKIRVWLDSTKQKRTARFKEKKYHRRHALDLTDGYVKNILRAIYKVTNAHITPEAIVLKRKALHARRAHEPYKEYVQELDQIFNKVRQNASKEY